MTENTVIDTKVLSQQYKEQAIPYKCPVCQKSYKSLAGILYHIGQFRGNTKVPRCMLGGGEETPKGTTPMRPGGAAPSSPSSLLRKKTPKREALTWAESQRLVEVEWDYEYHRLEIDKDVFLVADLNEVEMVDGGNEPEPAKSTPKSTNRRMRSHFTQSKSSSRNKCKKKSKLKTPSQDNPTHPQVVKLPEVSVTTLENGVDCSDAPPRDAVYYRFIEQSPEEIDEMIEYDMDEEDYQWLSLVNEERKNEGLTSVPQEAFELLMDRLEKECVFESKVSGDGGESVNPYNIDENAVCCICNDGECHNTNAILFCDMCNLAVHQECYGVPYIPEGQWLCRRCLQSPSRSVDCVLCPNKGGAFKQTINSRWAHVICGLWIPEVQFANPVFLEPIDGIQDIPSARWKLLCYICRKRCGACIQCAKANCYVAFHVTCAQQANLYMKIEMERNGEICKTAFCDSHTPPAARKKLMEIIKNTDSDEEIDKGLEEEEMASNDCVVVSSKGNTCVEDDGCKKGKSESKIVKRARKLLEEQRVVQAPVVNIPYVPQIKLDQIASRVCLHKKAQFIPKLVSYWKLKRQSRNGVPFLRRLQASNSKGHKTTISRNLSEEEREALTEQLSLWKGLRLDLERARMLIELVRKREKLKREQLRMHEEINRLRLTPLEMIMKRLLLKLSAKDPADIFAEPVPLEDVPDYLDIIKHPMDFKTMRQKIENHEYTNLSEFEKDLKLVWNNAMVYNQKDTIYYRAAIRIRDASKRIIEQAFDLIEVASISSKSGMHDPDVSEPPPLTPNTAAIIQRQPLELFTREGDYAEATNQNPKSRERLPSTTLDEQVEYLEEQLSVLESQCKGSTRKARGKHLRKELSSLKRQIKSRDKLNDSNNSVVDSPPRRKTVTTHVQDAEGLASQLRHGSLRLTVSRRAILSSSGIKLDEKAIMDEIDVNEPSEVIDNEMEDEEEEEKIEDEEEEEEKPIRDMEEEEEEEREINEVSTVYPKKLNQKSSERKSSCGGMRGVTWKDMEGSPLPKMKKHPRRRNRSYPMACERKRRDRKPRQRLLSETSNSDREEEEIEEATSTNGITLRTRSRNISGSTSSIDIIDEERPIRITRSSSSDVPYDLHHENRLPSMNNLSAATTTDATSTVNGSTTTTTSITTTTGLFTGMRKRRNSIGSDSDGPTAKRKKQTKEVLKQPPQQQSKGLNGLSNGLQISPQPLELVWAKCRGYPPYPALVIDPSMPSEGLKINGEVIQAPSEEVLEHGDKNPQNTILVRFFDGRRTWQWLHPSKLDYLGANKDFDHTQVNSSGASKRSVQQAYERAMSYHRKVIQSNNTEDSDEFSSSTTM